MTETAATTNEMVHLDQLGAKPLDGLLDRKDLCDHLPCPWPPRCCRSGPVKSIPRHQDMGAALQTSTRQCGCITLKRLLAGGLMTFLSTPDAADTSLVNPLDEVESTLTDRYQTTVPQPVRRALGLRKRDRIRYEFRANGEVVLQRCSPDSDNDDPALAHFLTLLEQDIVNQPERLQPIGAELVERLHDLVDGIEVDLEEALPDEA